MYIYISTSTHIVEQYNTIQYNTIQYNTIQYNTIQLYKFTTKVSIRLTAAVYNL